MGVFIFESEQIQISFIIVYSRAKFVKYKLDNCDSADKKSKITSDLLSMFKYIYSRPANLQGHFSDQ